MSNGAPSPSGGGSANRQKIEDMDVQHLTLFQLKGETVRLEREANRIEIRRRAVRERMNQIISMNRANASAKKRNISTSQQQTQQSNFYHCGAEGCTNDIYRNGMCERHYKRHRPICSAEGCTNASQRAGLCEQHSDYIRKRCQHEGCSLQARGGGNLCYRHGAKVKQCSFDGCTSRVQRRGLCIKHGARDGMIRCSYQSCRNVAREGGLCKKHRNESDTMNVEALAPDPDASSMMGFNPFDQDS